MNSLPNLRNDSDKPTIHSARNDSFPSDLADVNGRCAIRKKREARPTDASVIQFMNAPVEEQKTAVDSRKPTASKPREKQEMKLNTHQKRENGFWLHIAKLLEQRIAPQHWGINE